MIRLFVMDVDGTMTDGAVFLDGEGREFKRFDVKDGI
ncbi:MAG: 3-deoxy-D-manno-octulosonate 8-phosphate phosphatase, YrbI family [Synergistales bacterium 58_81]|nr:MAG: 3-deoxy-D-manno-octulosonate 8-phosphate phosphatase, YrbI family [Synergistales bacterium 58_81]